MATKNLDELRDKLYKAFDSAFYNSRGEMDARAESLAATAELAKSIVMVERELREAKESKRPIP